MIEPADFIINPQILETPSQPNQMESQTKKLSNALDFCIFLIYICFIYFEILL
jgi:hypothetical protein